MKWSFRIATVRGIDLKVHATFLFIIALVGMNWSASGLAGLAFGMTLMVLLFACVALHEFGHAFMARYFGLPVREIILLPIGGVALLGRPTRQPVQELLIAAAGPAVNVAIVLLLAPALYLSGEPLSGPGSLLRPDNTVPSVLAAVHWLLGANISLVLFNLVPAFPMDGGRILRGLLGLAFDWQIATRWAARTGQVIAGVMGIWAVLTGQMMLAVIAAMIFLAATSSDEAERAHATLSERTTGDACTRHPIVLTESDRIGVAVTHLLTSYQTDFAVMRSDSVVGVIERSDVLHAIAIGHGDSLVTSIMRPPLIVAADDSLAHTRECLLNAAVGTAAVFRGPVFAGLINLDDIREADAIFTVLDQQSGASPRVPPIRPRRVAVEA